MSEQALQRYSRAVRHMEPAGVVALAESHAELMEALDKFRNTPVNPNSILDGHFLSCNGVHEFAEERIPQRCVAAQAALTKAREL